jgi:hypothetical protein
MQYGDATHDLVVRAPELMDMPQEYRLMAVEICLDGAVGEETRLRLFDRVDVCAEFEGASRGRGIAMPEMAAQLRSLGLV